MFRRAAILLLLFSAYALLQAHNFIPHHHIDEPAVKHLHSHGHDSQSHSHEHEAENNDDTEQSNPIFYLTHSAEFGTSACQPSGDSEA